MTTIESPAVAALWHAIADRVGKGRVVFGGSVPDLATELPHSYHRSWTDSPHDQGYSVFFPGDRSLFVRTHNKDYACALDVTFHDPADIRKATARLHQWATTSGANWVGASRSPLLREAAGTIDGVNTYGMDFTRFRAPARTYGWDDTHLWHIHLSINRCHVHNAGIAAPIAAAFGDW